MAVNEEACPHPWPSISAPIGTRTSHTVAALGRRETEVSSGTRNWNSSFSLTVVLCFVILKISFHITKQNMKLRTGSLGPYSSYLLPVQNVCSSQWLHSLRPAVGLSTFRPQHSLCSFRVFVGNWLSLPTMATLLPVIMRCTVPVQIEDLCPLYCASMGLVFNTILMKSP